MNVAFVKFDTSGKILFTGEVPIDMLALQGEQVLADQADQADPRTHWVVDGQLASRPLLDIQVEQHTVLADGETGLIVRGVPAGASIVVNGPVTLQAQADGSDLHLTFAIPGRYSLAISLFPFQDWQGDVHAN